MEEDFQEAEVVFPESGASNRADHTFPSHPASRELRNKQPRRKKKKNNSVPLSIPQTAPASSWFQSVESDLFDDDDDCGGELVPPHVILARRLAGKMAFSVCTGNGRTLKGRDLSQVRNSILRMTGFIEA